MKKILCISRRYAPSIGGMATFATEVFSELKKSEDIETNLLVLGKNKWHFFWFYPYTLLYLLFFARKYDAIFVGDALMLFCGLVTKKVSPKTRRIVAVHGLDVTYSNRIYQMIIRKYLNNSFDLFICNSQATERLLIDRGNTKTAVITLGTNTSRFLGVPKNRDIWEKKYGIDNSKIILLTTGRLIKRKGVVWFLENVFPKLDNDYEYVIVGNGPEKNAIEKLIKKYGNDRVVLIDNASDSELNEIYLNSDLFIMPNIRVENDMEGFGLVAVEASLAGLVVIAADVDGISTAVVNEKNGYLVPTGDAGAFIGKIKELKGKDVSAKGEEFSNYTKANYNWKVVAENYKKSIIRECE